MDGLISFETQCAMVLGCKVQGFESERGGQFVHATLHQLEWVAYRVLFVRVVHTNVMQTNHPPRSRCSGFLSERALKFYFSNQYLLSRENTNELLAEKKEKTTHPNPSDQQGEPLQTQTKSTFLPKTVSKPKRESNIVPNPSQKQISAEQQP